MNTETLNAATAQIAPTFYDQALTFFDGLDALAGTIVEYFFQLILQTLAALPPVDWSLLENFGK